METNANSTFPKLLDENNYKKWSEMAKSDLMPRGLWSIVESTAKPPRREDDEAAFRDWSNKNSIALRLIQDSCGEIALNEIKEMRMANMAWWALAEKYNAPECYTVLIKALQRGEWDTAEKFFELLPRALSVKITPWGKTALHVAVMAGHEHIAEKLVKRMSEEALEIRADSDGLTALATAALHGNYNMVECMLNRREKLVGVRSRNGNLPVVTAIVYGHKGLGRYLYSRTPREDLMSGGGRNGAAVCTAAIYEEILDVALDLIQHHPELTLALDFNNQSPLFALASMPDAFLKANRLVLWKRWIYSCMHVQLPDALDEVRVNIRSVQGQATGSGVGFYFGVVRLLHQVLSNLLNLLGVEHLYGIKLAQTRSKKLLNLMCKELSEAKVEKWCAADVPSAVFRAIKEGIFEVVYETVKNATEILYMGDKDGRTIFSCAVLYRQAEIFSLIYGLPDKKAMAEITDHSANKIVHMAAMSAPSTQLNLIPGAALQMQRELQWFKEVESIVPHKVREAENEKGSRPRELFTENHKDLIEKGEKWMKDTATSCTVVGALIVTIMFAAAFTLPGGNNQDTGFPMFLKKRSFTVFIVSDSLSLLSSSTSVLMFLGILTSSYAEEDFLISLPRKLIIGLSTLFFSIATMMIAFCTALLVMFESQLWMVVPVICLACVPVTLFILLQFPILVNMVVSTYWSIFDRKKERWV